MYIYTLHKAHFQFILKRKIHILRLIFKDKNVQYVSGNQHGIASKTKQPYKLQNTLVFMHIFTLIHVLYYTL